MLPRPVYHYLHRENSITSAAISEKSFHAVQNAAQVYADVSSSLPELAPDARYLLIVSQKYIVQTLDLEEKAVRKKFAREHTQYRRALLGHLGFAMKYDKFSFLGRIEMVITAIGLFPTAVHIGRFFKKLSKKS